MLPRDEFGEFSYQAAEYMNRPGKTLCRDPCGHLDRRTPRSNRDPWNSVDRGQGLGFAGLGTDHIEG